MWLHRKRLIASLALFIPGGLHYFRGIEIFEPSESTDAPNNYEEIQAVRKSRIIATCAEYSGHGMMRPMNPYYKSKFWPGSLVLDQRKGIGWCRIDQVASAPFSALFLLLRSVNVSEVELGMMRDNNVSLNSLVKKIKTKPNERLHMIKGEHGKDYFTFLVVRHPFVRIVSAYRDKLENPTEGEKRIVMKMFNTTKAPSFPKFIDYLLRTPPNLMETYWAPYTKICSPCTFPYSAVLKLETIQQDLSWLTNKLLLDEIEEDWKTIRDMRISDVPSSQLVSNYFSQLPKEDIKRLYEKYKPDFQMFDYDNQIESFVQMGL